MKTTQSNSVTPKDAKNEIGFKADALDMNEKTETLSTIPQENAQQSQQFSHRKKKMVRRKRKNHKTYAHIGMKTSTSRISKNSPTNSTLNSSLSYFPSLKCSKNHNNSTFKNSNDTQRSVMESSALLFKGDYSPPTNIGSVTPFLYRNSFSLTRKRSKNLRNSPNREAERIGREKLNKFQNKKHKEYQLNLLKNRVSRLEQEEINAQKKIRAIETRAEKFIKARFNFNIQQQDKFQHNLRVQQDLKLKREKLNKERQESYERKKQIRMSMIERKLNEGHTVRNKLETGFKERDLRLK